MTQAQPGQIRACLNCDFWQRRKENDKGMLWGECRRYSPKNICNGMDSVSEHLHCGAWGVTYTDDWCGEFLPRQAFV